MKRLIYSDNRIAVGGKPEEETCVPLKRNVSRNGLDDLEIVCYRSFPVEFCLDYIDACGFVLFASLISLKLMDRGRWQQS